LVNAAWALAAATTLPCSTPRSARPRSRAAFTASRIDSVPPAVIEPDAPGGAAVQPFTTSITSAWRPARLGNAWVLSAFSPMNAA
jgi:hypothetical protein